MRPFYELKTLWLLPCLLVCGCGAGEKRWNVLLISLDTLRADRLGAYGHDRPDVSPAIDMLASQGVRFAHAVSQAPWTTPSHMSLLTSQYPSTHQVNQGWDSFSTLGKTDSAYRTLPDSAVTLAEILRDQNYKTMAMTGGGTMAGEIGFEQGFEIYEEHTEPLVERARMTELLEGAADQPFFLFLQSFEVHAPYSRLFYADPILTKEQQGEIEKLTQAPNSTINSIAEFLMQEGLFQAEVTTALYDGDIRYADIGLLWLFQELDRLGLADHTLIVVTSDHGEEFGEHDPEHLWDAHCFTVYDELTHVPLVIRAPGETFRAGSVVDHQVELIDVAPTVLDLLGVAAPPGFQGASLKPLMDGQAPQEEPWALSEATCGSPEMKSIRSSRYKYIAAYSAENDERSGVPGAPLWEQLFDLTEDPREQKDLSDQEPKLLAELRAKLEQRLRTAESKATGDAQTAPVKGKTVDRLKSLGYVQ